MGQGHSRVQHPARRLDSGPLTVGVVSDTHGLLRPEALAALAGAALVIHAGDVGAPAVLEALRGIAPVLAVRGNNDRGPWADALPETIVTEIAGARVCVVHDLATLALDPAREGVDVVVAGHSHRPRVERRGPLLYLNPGSAGPRRFTLPVTVARLTLGAGAPRAELVPLAVVAVGSPQRTISGRGASSSRRRSPGSRRSG